MSKVRVQCKGSGKQIAAGINARRGMCPVCGNVQDLTGAQKIRKHMRLTSTAKLRKL